MLGIEPDVGGVGQIEIDESELIGRENQILRMFGLNDRKNNDQEFFASWKTDEK